jgi:hypothetical protein
MMWRNTWLLLVDSVILFYTVSAYKLNQKKNDGVTPHLELTRWILINGFLTFIYIICKMILELEGLIKNYLRV